MDQSIVFLISCVLIFAFAIAWYVERLARKEAEGELTISRKKVKEIDNDIREYFIGTLKQIVHVTNMKGGSFEFKINERLRVVGGECSVVPETIIEIYSSMRKLDTYNREITIELTHNNLVTINCGHTMMYEKKPLIPVLFHIFEIVSIECSERKKSVWASK